MKTFSIEFEQKGEIRCEFLQAYTNTAAVKLLMERLKIGKTPVMLKIIKIREVK